jgi:hypothetical protein
MKQVNLIPLLVLISLTLLNSITSCRKTDIKPVRSSEDVPSAGKKPDNPGFSDNNMVLYWNEKTSIVLTGPFTPPAQSRHFAMVQIAVHDALNAIKPKYERFALTKHRSQFANADAAVASAAYWAIQGMNVKGLHPLDDWYNASLATVPEGESKELGKALGKTAAEAVIAKRASDNFAEANMQIALPDGVNPGEYRSTLPFSLPGMPLRKALHQWGTKMLPFITENNYQFRPSPPFPIQSSEYAEEYNEVKLKGARVAHNRTADEDEIGRFWVERCAIGWNRFARTLVAAKKMDAWKTARLFAVMHTAMTDLASGNFEAKYHYFYWRPETAIRMGNEDGNQNTSGDENWLPSYTEGPNPANPLLNVNTPPIPEYPSLHAGLGGAAAEVLKQFFETDNISVKQTSPTTPGITRHYSSISQAARDNSLSRIYVGYHFRKACLAGEEQGKQIAAYVFNNSFKEAK